MSASHPLLAVQASIGLVVGILAGLLHFATLHWSVRLLTSSAPVKAIVLQLTRLGVLAAILNVECYEKLDARVACQNRRASGSEQQLIVLAPSRDAIGKCRQHRKRQSVGIMCVRLRRTNDPAIWWRSGGKEISKRRLNCFAAIRTG